MATAQNPNSGSATGTQDPSPVPVITPLNPLIAEGQLIRLLGALMSEYNNAMFQANNNIASMFKSTFDIAKDVLNDRQLQAFAQLAGGATMGSLEIGGGLVGVYGSANEVRVNVKQNTGVENECARVLGPKAAVELEMPNGALPAAPAGAGVGAAGAVPAAAAAAPEEIVPADVQRPRAPAEYNYKTREIIQDKHEVENASEKTKYSRLAQIAPNFGQALGQLSSAVCNGIGTLQDGRAAMAQTSADVAKTEAGMIDSLKQSMQQAFDSTGTTVSQIMQAILATSRGA